MGRYVPEELIALELLVLLELLVPLPAVFETGALAVLGLPPVWVCRMSVV